ncbi:hypothetical protein T11_12111 [Trichinella zimbabwensis]|uniref:Uncharacterized protein n=1 Tax=Trichinella zimbabwensis TaxID=268475 RepID=A0A0V1GVF1_9BILA|nr:hypothetical protein T11_12111 [Trichinella zimbabwensis]
MACATQQSAMLYYKNRKSHDTTGDMRSPFLSINVDSCGGTGIWDPGVGAVVLKQPCDKAIQQALPSDRTSNFAWMILIGQEQRLLQFHHSATRDAGERPLW